MPDLFCATCRKRLYEGAESDLLRPAHVVEPMHPEDKRLAICVRCNAFTQHRNALWAVVAAMKRAAGGRLFTTVREGRHAA